jgi:NAD(P)-dependent dehydrogenase (short-subunit alcohol dehydrogenase family)
VVAVHLKGTFAMSRHACEYWREEHKKGNMLNGRIINTASDAGLLGNVGQSNYGACKAAVAAMAIIIGQEMKKYGVTANAIAPVARTRLTIEATPSTAGLMGGEVKPGEFDMFGPQNIAPLVAWLASDAFTNPNAPAGPESVPPGLSGAVLQVVTETGIMRVERAKSQPARNFHGNKRFLTLVDTLITIVS